jgi:glycosyltransferase involved in cell wall biosynthesis
MFTYLHSLTRLAVRRAHLIITDSTHARREIVTHSGLPAERVLVAPLAQDPARRPVEDSRRLADTQERHGLTRPFVLADALKNPAVLIRAWRRLPTGLRERFQMVFFCRRPDPLPIIREAEAEGHARLLVRPSREDLIALYSQAQAFVFPSWIEGFGLPVLEAMTCGAPVIASDRGSIPEVAGEAALLIDAEDDAALAQGLAQVLGDPAEAARWRARGFARAALFSWRGTAQSILDAYRQALELPPAARLAAVDRQAA